MRRIVQLSADIRGCAACCDGYIRRQRITRFDPGPNRPDLAVERKRQIIVGTYEIDLQGFIETGYLSGQTVDADRKFDVRLRVPISKKAIFNEKIAEDQRRGRQCRFRLLLAARVKGEIGCSGAVKFYNHLRFDKNQMGKIKFAENQRPDGYPGFQAFDPGQIRC